MSKISLVNLCIYFIVFITQGESHIASDALIHDAKKMYTVQHEKNPHIS
jgi:hypothetical protein